MPPARQIPDYTHVRLLVLPLAQIVLYTALVVIYNISWFYQVLHLVTIHDTNGVRACDTWRVTSCVLDDRFLLNVMSQYYFNPFFLLLI